MTGVGVYREPFWIITATPWAAKTSMAVASAASERAWVSMPMKSGPSIFFAFPVFADGLADGQDVGLVEAVSER